MNKQRIFTSTAAIAVCASIAAGGTYALFTHESKTNIAATAGEVEVVATIGDLSVYSPTLIATDGTILDDTNAATTETLTFKNKGTASISGGTLTLDKMTPGDKATFNIQIENKSDVAIQWQSAFEAQNDTGLFAGLAVTIDEEQFSGVKTKSEWTYVDAGAAIDPATISVVVELPTTAGNIYEGTSCDIEFAIHAIQSNAAPVEADLSKLTGEEAKSLSGKLYLGMLNADLTTENPDLAVGDGNFMQSGVTEIIFNDGVINTPYDGTIFKAHIPSQSVPHVYNESNGSRILLNVPQNTKVVFNDLTINGLYNFIDTARNKNLTLEFVNCTFNGCWIGETNGLTNIKFTNCRFTLIGIDSANVKDTNPIWWGSMNGQTLAFDGCTFETNRPIKYGEGAEGATLKVTNSTFKLASSQYDIANNRPDRVTAIRFDDKVTNVTITGNKMLSGYALCQTNDEKYDGTHGNNTIPADALWRVEY